MSTTQALILAAGRGSRLGRAGEETPKALLEVGGRPLIQHQLDALGESGVGPVQMVVGYEADRIHEAVGVQAEYVHNPRWESTNSLYSFWLARDVIRGDVLVLNSDVLFAPEVLNRLLDTPGDAIAIDTSSGIGREQMKVQVVQGRVVQMSKELPASDVSGENLGILKLSAETAAVLFENAGELIAAGRLREWLATSIAAVARDRDLRAVDMAGIPWVEIDFAVDLVRAQKEIWPAIQGNSYRKGRIRKAAALTLGAVVVGGAMLLAGMALAPERTMPGGWETIPIETVHPTRIELGQRPQSWWLLREGQIAEARVTGPGKVRIESRLLDPAGPEASYVLEAALNGTLVDRYTITSRPSAGATHPEWTVCSRNCETADLPAGPHALQVRVVAPPDTACLVRIRQLESHTEE